MTYTRKFSLGIYLELTNLALIRFKAYDIRGRLSVELDENIANRISAAFAIALSARPSFSEEMSERFRRHWRIA